jgi:hypothetical protein
MLKYNIRNIDMKGKQNKLEGLCSENTYTSNGSLATELIWI